MAFSHRYPLAVSLMAVLLVSGCATVAPSDQISSHQSETLGGFYGVTLGCHEVGSYNAEEKAKYQGIMESYMDAAVYDKEAFGHGLMQAAAAFQSQESETLRAQCDQQKSEMKQVLASFAHRRVIVDEVRKGKIGNMVKTVVGFAL